MIICPVNLFDPIQKKAMKINESSITTINNSGIVFIKKPTKKVFFTHDKVTKRPVKNQLAVRILITACINDHMTL